jgi:hypothetical protein
MAVFLPITHTAPNAASGEVGIEIPPRVKQHLGLDWERSWVIVSECNLDSWPSPDLRQLPSSRADFTTAICRRACFARFAMPSSPRIGHSAFGSSTGTHRERGMFAWPTANDT